MNIALNFISRRSVYFRLKGAEARWFEASGVIFTQQSIDLRMEGTVLCMPYPLEMLSAFQVDDSLP